MLKTRAHSLSALTEHSSTARGVRRSDMKAGDVLMIYTLNSVYTARQMRDGRFSVKGGWFDKHHASEVITSISGCTWGGKCINKEFVASCGMQVEFGNRVLTSVLQRVVRIPATLLN